MDTADGKLVEQLVGKLAVVVAEQQLVDFGEGPRWGMLAKLAEQMELGSLHQRRSTKNS